MDPKMRVLVVDDMMTMRKIVSKICRDIGFTDLTEAVNGAEAWQKVTEATVPFDLIISDWNMPQSTGLDLLKRVRSDSRFGSTLFIMVTAESEKSQIVEALKARVSGYIIKPFTADILKEKLNQIMGGPPKAEEKKATTE